MQQKPIPYYFDLSQQNASVLHRYTCSRLWAKNKSFLPEYSKNKAVSNMQNLCKDHSIIDKHPHSYLTQWLLCWHSPWFGSVLTHWGWDKMAAFSHTTFSKAFSWMKNYEFRFKFHWSLFLRVQFPISELWFRKWLGTKQATSHYLNQWWPSLLMHIYVTQLPWVKIRITFQYKDVT